LKGLGLLTDDNPDAAAVLRAWLLHLAAGDAEFLLVNLKDLWLEPAPQIVPGTWEERPNWKRKARYSLEQVHEFGALRETLAAIDKARMQESENDA
jgi:4-alpha-glucanotransferase